MTKRVQFGFDDRSLTVVKKLKAQGYEFDEVATTDPETGETRIAMIPKAIAVPPKRCPHCGHYL